MVAVLDPQTVTEIFTDCLFRDGEDTSGAVTAEGIMINAGFHPGRLAAHDHEIAELLDDLPDQFKTSTGGGGWSFLNACTDRRGDLWTGMHATVEQLMLLGLAAGRVSCPMPRELWSALPGGMPYYTVLDGAAVKS